MIALNSNGATQKALSTLYIFRGNMEISDINISNNQGKEKSGFSITGDKKSEVLNFSSFISNTLENEKYIFYINPYYTSYSVYVEFCNFINNKRTTSDTRYGLIHSTKGTKFSDCVFIGNEKSPLFKNDHASYPTTVTHCYIDQESHAGQVNYVNNRENADQIKLRMINFEYETQPSCIKCSDSMCDSDHSIYYMMTYSIVLSFQ